MVLTKEDLQQIRLPLSVIDYLKLYGAEEAGQPNWTKEFPELSNAFNKLGNKYFYMTYKNLYTDDTFPVLPPMITTENVGEIQDPKAREVALKELLKRPLKQEVRQKLEKMLEEVQ